MSEQLARKDFEALWRDMDKSREVPPEYLNRLSELIDEYMSNGVMSQPANPIADESEPEPVAWRYRHPLNQNLWVVVAGPDWPERDQETEPLYTSSPSPGGGIVGFEALSFVYALLGSDSKEEAAAVWEDSPTARASAYSAVHRALSTPLPAREVTWPDTASPLPWTYKRQARVGGFSARDWIEDATGSVVVEDVGHIDGPAICAAVNGPPALPAREVESSPTLPITENATVAPTLPGDLRARADATEKQIDQIGYEPSGQTLKDVALDREAAAHIEQLEKRSKQHWTDAARLRDAILGDRPRCRDCADEDGTCPTSGLPCDPTDAAVVRARKLRAAEALVSKAREALAYYAEPWTGTPPNSGPGGNDPQDGEWDLPEWVTEDRGRRAALTLKELNGDR